MNLGETGCEDVNWSRFCDHDESLGSVKRWEFPDSERLLASQE
jgi:hypothetical protein